MVANVDDDIDLEIVTGGYYNDNSRDVAQLVVWGSNLATVENLAGWYWTGDTRIESIHVGDVDSDGSTEIVTGGYYFDEYSNSQLVVFKRSKLAVDYLTDWRWSEGSSINSVVVGSADADVAVEILTGGYWNDGTRDNAQLVKWEIT